MSESICSGAALCNRWDASCQILKEAVAAGCAVRTFEVYTDDRRTRLFVVEIPPPAAASESPFFFVMIEEAAVAGVWESTHLSLANSPNDSRLHKSKDVAAMLKAIHGQEDRPAAQQKAQDVVTKLKAMKLSKAAARVEEGAAETFSYMTFPREHWTRTRTNNTLERIMREIRRRTRVVGAFPDGRSALMLVAARLRHIASTRWGSRAYLDMKRLKEEKLIAADAG